jgi:hypothetical protein
MIITNGAKTSDWIAQVNGVISAYDPSSSMPAIGTTTVNVPLVFTRPPVPPEMALARYRQLKSAIVASGVPLLSDDEVLEELRARRGERES